jgi:hypothetical protein
MSPILVDLLYKMLTSQFVAGDGTIEHNVHFLFIDKKFTAAILFSTEVDQIILKGKEALADLGSYSLPHFLDHRKIIHRVRERLNR